MFKQIVCDQRDSPKVTLFKYADCQRGLFTAVTTRRRGKEYDENKPSDQLFRAQGSFHSNYKLNAVAWAPATSYFRNLFGSQDLFASEQYSTHWVKSFLLYYTVQWDLDLTIFFKTKGIVKSRSDDCTHILGQELFYLFFTQDCSKIRNYEVNQVLIPVLLYLYESCAIVELRQIITNTNLANCVQWRKLLFPKKALILFTILRNYVSLSCNNY